jgi:hypothetical protein
VQSYVLAAIKRGNEEDGGKGENKCGLDERGQMTDDRGRGICVLYYLLIINVLSLSKARIEHCPKDFFGEH